MILCVRGTQSWLRRNRRRSVFTVESVTWSTHFMNCCRQRCLSVRASMHWCVSYIVFIFSWRCSSNGSVGSLCFQRLPLMHKCQLLSFRSLLGARCWYVTYIDHPELSIVRSDADQIQSTVICRNSWSFVGHIELLCWAKSNSLKLLFFWLWKPFTTILKLSR